MAKPTSDDKEIARKREILHRAIIDAKYRKDLFADPEKVFGGPLSDADKAAVQRLKLAIPGLEQVLDALAGNILCGGGGGCPGLA